MYQGMFDNKHFAYRVDLKNFKQSYKIPSGEYESNILCKECDNNILGKYENYAKKVLYGGSLSKDDQIYFENRQNQHGVKMIYCKGIDYTIFKLFLLSFLWRANISKREFYRHDNIIGYTFLIGGFLYQFLISKTKKPKWLHEVAINKNNELSIVHMGEAQAKKIISYFMQIEPVILPKLINLINFYDPQTIPKSME